MLISNVRRCAKYLFLMLVVFSVSVGLKSSISHATIKVPEFPLENLQGVDTVVYLTGLGRDASGLINLTKGDVDAVIGESLKAVLGPSIIVESHRGKNLDDLNKPNIIIIRFGLNVRNDSVAKNKTVNTASLTMQIRQSYYHKPSMVIPTLNESYPFIVSSNTSESEQSIAEGVKFLTAHIASYFRCLKETACNLVAPYGWD